MSAETDVVENAPQWEATEPLTRAELIRIADNIVLMLRTAADMFERQAELLRQLPD